MLTDDLWHKTSWPDICRPHHGFTEYRQNGQTQEASQIEGRSEQITNDILHKLALNPSPNSANNEQFYGISAST